MNLPERTEAICKLGQLIRQLGPIETKELSERARNENAWFTDDNVALALRGLAAMLEEDKVLEWVMRYPAERDRVKTVGVAMAGNIPFVGFHDLLCVMISGHKLKTKLSSQDSVLFKFVMQKLISIDRRFEDQVTVEARLNDVDAIIATGSDNTARYFEFYFRNIPHIIRKNRSSCGVLMGEENEGDLKNLGQDVFSYFGLGCRNVSKLFVPDDFDFARLIESWAPYRHVVMHSKYANNYDYQKSILLVNQDPFLDGEFVILKKDSRLVSPVSVLYFENYSDQSDLKAKIGAHRDKLQVIASAKGWFENSIPFGSAQFPAIDDYADNIDTMKFLTGL
jgi:hypothetical protein